MMHNTPPITAGNLFAYRQLERRTFEARWPILVAALVLVFVSQSPPVWVSLLALMGYAAHNIARFFLFVRGSPSWIIRGGTILFSLDLGITLVGAWPLLHDGITAVMIALYALQLEAVIRSRRGPFPHAVLRITASTLVLATYATVAAPPVGGIENAAARIILFVLVGVLGIFDATRCRRSKEQALRPTASYAKNGVISDSTQPRAEEPILANEQVRLTRQQRRVLLLVGEGLTNDEVADRMNVGSETVKTHLRGAYRRLGVGDRESAARVARDHGLLD